MSPASIKHATLLITCTMEFCIIFHESKARNFVGHRKIVGHIHQVMLHWLIAGQTTLTHCLVFSIIGQYVLLARKYRKHESSPDIIRINDIGSLQEEARSKSVGLVQRSAAIWRCSACIKWTGWTLAMAVQQWKHSKYCLYYYHHHHY